MPQFMVSNGGEMPRFARIDKNGRKMVWVDIENATGFATPEAARAAFEECVHSMVKAAQIAGERAVGEKTVVASNKPAEKWMRREGGEWSTASDPAQFFTLEWVWKAKDQLHKFPVGARPTKDDLLGVFETFYIRSGAGWLCRPQRKYAEGRLEWNESFSLAVPFASAEDARARLQKQGAAGSIVRTSCVFTQVEFDSAHARNDSTATMIAAACEARDIHSAIEQSASERLAAMRNDEKKDPGEGAAEKEAKKSRRASRL